MLAGAEGKGGGAEGRVRPHAGQCVACSQGHLQTSHQRPYKHYGWATRQIC